MYVCVCTPILYYNIYTGSSAYLAVADHIRADSLIFFFGIQLTIALLLLIELCPQLSSNCLLSRAPSVFWLIFLSSRDKDMVQLFNPLSWLSIRKLVKEVHQFGLEKKVAQNTLKTTSKLEINVLILCFESNISLVEAVLVLGVHFKCC